MYVYDNNTCKDNNCYKSPYKSILLMFYFTLTKYYTIKNYVSTCLPIKFN